MTHPWLARYPLGVPVTVDPGACATLVDMLEDGFARHGGRPALHFMGSSLDHAEVDRLSRGLGAWMLAQGLVRGDRVAVMMPNVPQVAVTVAAALRAGLVVVPVDPLFTARELEHVLKDSGARLVVVMEACAATLQAVLASVPTRLVLLAAMGDLLGPFRGALVNHVWRHVRKRVPAFELPQAVRFGDALAVGRTLAFEPTPPGPGDIAVLQYSSGTTGPAKGAVLLHRQLVAGVLQAEAWLAPALRRVPSSETPTLLAWLPLHQVASFHLNLLLGWRLGARLLLLPEPRDIPAAVDALTHMPVHGLVAASPLFGALAHHPDADDVDWQPLVLGLAGGMPVQPAVARRWREVTGGAICEGYGLAETGPLACCQPVDGSGEVGSIGLPLPGTELAILDDAGHPLAPGLVGEIAIRGPQVMAGYWQRPEETARVMTADGFLRTGDVGTMDAQGFFRIVERKKDLIRVHGVAVCPQEIEDLVATMPGVLEVAAVGVPDEQGGEAVKLVIARSDPALSEDAVRRHCETRLDGTQRPRIIEFRPVLPKSPVGRILRRELRG